jgi:hypothetical protein
VRSVPANRSTRSHFEFIYRSISTGNGGVVAVLLPITFRTFLFEHPKLTDDEGAASRGS